MNSADLGNDIDILAARIERAVRDGFVKVDALGLASVMRHGARELAAGHLDSGLVLARRISREALNAAEKANR
jgi:hypothetical protein